MLRVYDDAAEVDRVVGLIRAAELDATLTLPAAADERADWVGRQREGEGVPADSLGPRPVSIRAPHRDLAPGPDPERVRVPFETTPTNMPIMATSPGIALRSRARTTSSAASASSSTVSAIGAAPRTSS